MCILPTSNTDDCDQYNFEYGKYILCIVEIMILLTIKNQKSRINKSFLWKSQSISENCCTLLIRPACNAYVLPSAVATKRTGSLHTQFLETQSLVQGTNNKGLLNFRTAKVFILFVIFWACWDYYFTSKTF